MVAWPILVFCFWTSSLDTTVHCDDFKFCNRHVFDKHSRVWALLSFIIFLLKKFWFSGKESNRIISVRFRFGPYVNFGSVRSGKKCQFGFWFFQFWTEPTEYSALYIIIKNTKDRLKGCLFKWNSVSFKERYRK